MYSFLVRAGGLHDLGPSNEKVAIVYLTTNIEGITLTAKHMYTLYATSLLSLVIHMYCLYILYIMAYTIFIFYFTVPATSAIGSQESATPVAIVLGLILLAIVTIASVLGLLVMVRYHNRKRKL